MPHDGQLRDAVALHQIVREHPAFDRILDHHRDDVAVVSHVRDAFLIQPLAQVGDALLLQLALSEYTEAPP